MKICCFPNGKSAVFECEIQFLDRKSTIFECKICHCTKICNFHMENLQFLDANPLFSHGKSSFQTENLWFLRRQSTVFRWKTSSFGWKICCFWVENLWFSGQMVLKGFNLVHNTKIRSNGLDKNQLGRKCKNQVILF